MTEKEWKRKNYLRTFVKGVVWELLGLVIIYVLTYSISTSLTYIGIRIGLYFIYHRLWKSIKWGTRNGNTGLSSNGQDT